MCRYVVFCFVQSERIAAPQLPISRSAQIKAFGQPRPPDLSREGGEGESAACGRLSRQSGVLARWANSQATVELVHARLLDTRYRLLRRRLGAELIRIWPRRNRRTGSRCN